MRTLFPNTIKRLNSQNPLADAAATMCFGACQSVLIWMRLGLRVPSSFRDSNSELRVWCGILFSSGVNRR